MSELIRLENVSLRYGQKNILDTIDLSIHSNEIITIIGPNGAGKSTLLKVILGLITPTGGSISKKSKLSIGYVPQKLTLNDTLPLTVERFLQLAKNYSKEYANQLLTTVKADHLLKNDIRSLSGGETQRVLLANALLRKPELLVLDEPAQGVDVQGQVELYQLIETIKQQFQCAILMVSHDLHLVMAKTDRVICLQHHICCSGSPESISDHSDFKRLFGHHSMDSLALYQHSHNHSHDLSGQTYQHDHTDNNIERKHHD